MTSKVNHLDGPDYLEAARSDIAVYLRGVSLAFGTRKIFDSIDLDVYAGQFIAILGASGSGKTTLLRVLAGLDAVDDGEVVVPRVRTTVFQEPRLIQSKRVWQNVVLGLRNRSRLKGTATAALAEVGLAEKSGSWPATLSGGEAQRVALARALVREPQLLLLDEPFAALDALTRLNMQELVTDLYRRHHPTVLVVTHDVDEAIRLADRIVVLKAGRLALDIRSDLDLSRRLGGPEFDKLRARLLAELGVHAFR
jgi:sulfonate transport system ATP-binding protein